MSSDRDRRDTDGRNPGRVVWLDRLRVVAIFAVVLLHAAAPLLLEFGRVGSVDWWVGNLYDASVRWSVPVFVMVSGALLLGRAHREPLRHFLGRRLARVAVPFLAWSVLYFYWQRLFWKMERPTSDLVPELLAGPISFHLWFVYMLVGLYLLAPLVGAFLEAASPDQTAWAVALWLTGAGLLPMAQRLIGVETWFSPERENSPLMLIGYFLLGALLAERALSVRQVRVAAAVLVLAVAVTAASTYWLTRSAGGEYQPLFYEYYSLNVVVMSVALFLLAADHGRRRDPDPDSRRGRTWRWLSARVFGVYLVHVIVLDLLKNSALGFALDETTGHPVLAVPLLTAATLLGSVALVLVVERLPGIRRVLL